MFQAWSAPHPSMSLLGMLTWCCFPHFPYWRALSHGREPYYGFLWFILSGVINLHPARGIGLYRAMCSEEPGLASCSTPALWKTITVDSGGTMECVLGTWSLSNSGCCILARFVHASWNPSLPPFSGSCFPGSSCFLFSFLTISSLYLWESR